MHGLRRALVFATGAVVPAVMAAPPAASATAYAGTCALVLTATYSAPLTVVPGPRTMVAGGSGTCVVNGLVGTGRFAAQLSTTVVSGGIGCAGGLVTGTGTLEIDLPGITAPVLEVVVADAGGVISLVAFNLTPHVLRFEGSGTFVRDPMDTVACVTSGLSTTTWTGPFSFQDPDSLPAA